MVKIRLKRIGVKKKPFYRVVVADSRAPRNGRLIEEIGIYDPMTDPIKFEVDMDKVREWVANGAQMTDTVKRLVKNIGGMDKQTTVEITEAEASTKSDELKEAAEEVAPVDEEANSKVEETATKETAAEETATKEDDKSATEETATAEDDKSKKEKNTSVDGDSK